MRSVNAISTTHAKEVENLPFHHKDPFDRIMIAQAKIEDAVIITRDGFFKEYEIKIIQT